MRSFIILYSSPYIIRFQGKALSVNLDTESNTIYIEYKD
jgi:hypothetical protein